MANNGEPLVGFHFAIELSGKVTGYFTECSGLSSEHEVIEHKVVTPEGKEVVMKVPGRLKWDNVTLKRGITREMDMWKWRKEVEQGNVESARCSGSVIMYDSLGKPAARWNFERAWPVKISGPQTKSDSNELGIEELTIAFEYIERVE